MKVLLINKYHYLKGGSETYYFGLAELLKSKGNQVIYFAMADEKNIPCEQEDCFVSNVDFNGKTSKWQKIKAGFRVIYSFEAKKKITELIKKEKPDVVHINLVHRHITLSVLRAIKKFNIPVIMTVHDLNCICPNHTMSINGEPCQDCIKGKFSNCVKKKCMKNSRIKSLLAAIEAYNYKRMKIYNDIDLYICPSDFYRKKHVEAGFTNRDIVRMKNFLPVGTEFSKTKEHGNYYLYLGRLSEEKGVVQLVKAFQKLQDDTPVYILGTGHLEDELKNYVQKYNLQQKVRLMGFKSGDELKSYVAKAKCIIMPSAGNENCPYGVMEAMSQGKPVIVTRIGGLPEIVQQGVNGFICEPDNLPSICEAVEKMNRLSTDQYEKMADSALKIAEKEYNCHNYYNQLMAYYKKYIAKHQNE